MQHCTNSKDSSRPPKSDRLPVSLLGSSIEQCGVVLPLRTAKILMLHGTGSSGTFFEAKSAFIKKLLQEAFPSFPNKGYHATYPGGIEFHYPTAPNRVLPVTSTSGVDEVEEQDEDKFDAWTWGIGDYEKDHIIGYEKSVKFMLRYIEEHGPFIGVIGFSAGGSMAFTLASLAERTCPAKVMEDLQITNMDLPPTFKFAICYGSFMLAHPKYRPLYDPQIRTPILHFIGKWDTITSEDQTMKLVECCGNPVVIRHLGGHIMPKSKDAKNAMMEFIKMNFGGDIKEQIEEKIEENVKVDLSEDVKGGIEEDCSPIATPKVETQKGEWASVLDKLNKKLPYSAGDMTIMHRHCWQHGEDPWQAVRFCI